MARGYDIGGLLARSGAMQGQQIAQGYNQLGQGLSGLFTGVADVVERGRERKQEAASQQQFQQLLERYKNDPAGMQREGLMKAASSNPTDQRLGQLLLEEAARIAGVQKEAQTQKTTATTGRGEGELMALANDPKFDLNNPKMRSGYIGMADSFGVSRKRAMEIALEAREAKEEKTGDGDFRKSDEVIIRDSKGHKFTQYSIQDINDPTSTPVIKYVPIGDAPDKPVGDVTIISQTTGASAFDKPEIKGDVTTAEEFSKVRVQAAEEIPTLVSQRTDIELAIESLDQISTAGIPAQVENYLRSATGGQDPNVANYELLVGEAMFARLKPLFGGVISEGERQAIVSLYSNLKRGNPANRSILEQMKRKLDETIEKGNLIRSSENFDEYNLKLDKFFPESSKQDDTNTIDYSSLPQG